ncbi:hypothetical protein L6R53_23190 [Myxococcota bacterium]|nr:hypothetical protein [Myxococcota bacterium]
MRRSLFPRGRPAPDARPALFSVVSLMVVLVPLLLVTSTGQKVTGLSLGLPGPSEELPPPPPGPVEALRVARVPEGYRVQAAVRRTDVLASAGDVEQQELLAADLATLQAQLVRLKALDPGRQRIHLAPGADTPASEVVRWMDAVRQGPQGPLFPEVVVESAP